MRKIIITEYELRANWHKNKEETIIIPRGSVITPAARDFLRQKGIQVQIQGDGVLNLNQINYSTSRQSMLDSSSTITSGRLPLKQEPVYYAPPGNRLIPRSEYKDRGKGSIKREAVESPKPVKINLESDLSAEPIPAAPGKPEHMTHLHGGALTAKTHPIIALRGQLDLFHGELAETLIICREHEKLELLCQLQEIGGFARELMAAEVRRIPFQFTSLLGFIPEQLREMSHHPERYFGIQHSPIHYEDGIIVIKLHQLRARIREVELAAVRAFTDDKGRCSRSDIVQALNRLSSALYILVCRERAGNQEEKRIPVGISNRHVHLSRSHLDILFGSGYQLSNIRDLRQPGQFAAQEIVTLAGPKGSIDKVRVLGPVRTQTQVEVSVTDCFTLGVRPLVRDSGKLEGTEGVSIIGPAGKVILDHGVIAARRHLHMHTDQAIAYGLHDGSKVSIRIEGHRPVIFEDVLVRVGPAHELEMHLDTDEANAALISGEQYGVIMGVAH